MKIKDNYEIREIAGEHIIVPIGETTLNFNGMITVNEVGKFLWLQLKEECTEEELVQKMLEEYDVDEVTARQDIGKFVEKLKSEGLV